ncbi:MAG: phosphatidylserine decarboxylase family protein [Desulfobacteraceae bacterium]|nr:phosphatidylserine decarboxylase family protein [Desulfobacteraceae bacterium]
MSTEDFRHKYSHIPVAREGIPFIGAAMFATLITAVLGWSAVTMLLLAVTLLIGHFFRDPERVTNATEGEAVSPADGRVIGVERVGSVPLLNAPAMKISIFMSLFDVHVNRVPVSGAIRGMRYSKGGFKAANLSLASRENERNSLWIGADSGVDVVITQVAGLIARRIVCWPGVGDGVVRGERFGMIRFGSRMDVYVPERSDILVAQGQHVYAGETVLCRMK